MINNKLKRCCKECRYVEIKLNGGQIKDSWGSIMDTKYAIYCVHDKV